MQMFEKDGSALESLLQMHMQLYNIYQTFIKDDWHYISWKVL